MKESFCRKWARGLHNFFLHPDPTFSDIHTFPSVVAVVSMHPSAGAVTCSPALEGFSAHVVSVGVEHHMVLVPTPLHHHLY